MDTVRTFENITLKTLCFETYVRYAVHNVCNVCMPQAIRDVISSIGIGAAAANRRILLARETRATVL